MKTKSYTPSTANLFFINLPRYQNKKGSDKTEPDTNPVRRRLKLIETLLRNQKIEIIGENYVKFLTHIKENYQ